MKLSAKTAVISSPFIIIAINLAVAFLFRPLIGKWSFIPIILIERCLFAAFMYRYAGLKTVGAWLKPLTNFLRLESPRPVYRSASPASLSHAL